MDAAKRVIRLSGHHRVTGRRIRIVAAVVAYVLTAGTAFAQTSPMPTPTPRPSAPSARSTRQPGRWMFEIHGGGFGQLLSGQLSGQATAIDGFPTGASFTTLAGQPSRTVSSWAYGDGVALFDDVRRSFASTHGVVLPAITPLDSVMRTSGITRKPANAFGGRLSGNLWSWLGIELAVDRGSSGSALSSAVLAGADATRASYTSAFQALLATIPQNNGRVTATVTSSPEASAAQTVATASAVLSLLRVGRVGLHTVLGGGYVLNDAPELEVRLQGGYQFSILSTFPINESETVTIRYAEKKQVPAAVAGLGLTLRVAGQSGLRVDARVLASQTSTTTTVDSSAARVIAPQLISFPSLTTPSIQFNTITGARTTLSGDPVNGLVTYSSRGWDLRPHVTVRYYVRF